MGLLDRLFGKRDAAEEEESLPSHQARYDHHAPIDIGEWGQEAEPRLDIDFAVEPTAQEPQTVDVLPQEESAPQCKAAEGEQHTIVLTVMAQEGDYFEGGDLLREFNACGLHIGKDHLFHRYPEQGEQVPLFSVSNVLNPGVFDPQKIMTLQTRGILLFAQLPSVHLGKLCFGALVESANSLAMGLGGQVMDGERRPLNNHMLQRMQEQVLEFEYCRELERRKAEQGQK